MKLDSNLLLMEPKINLKSGLGLKELTTSGVDAPSVVCEAESALLLLALLLLSPGRPSALVPGPVSLSSITKSIGILPFRQLMYR